MLDSKDFYLNGVSYNIISFFIKSYDTYGVVLNQIFLKNNVGSNGKGSVYKH